MIDHLIQVVFSFFWVMILYFHLASTGLGIFGRCSDLTLGMIFKQGFNHQSVVMILKYILCLGSEVPGLRGIYSEHPSCKGCFCYQKTTGTHFQKWQVGRSIAGNYQCKTDHWMEQCCFCQPNGVRSTQLAVWVPDTRGQQGA